MSGGKSKEQTVGYKYFAGVHFVLCHGPIDKITRLQVDDRTAWEGSAEAAVNPVRIDVNKPELFGGKKREGGISGAVDVLFGYPAQAISDYLSAKIGSVLVPAYRGVTSLVLRQVYQGNNPYLKPWAITAQRIHVRGSGQVQWYDEKAEVTNAVGQGLSFIERFDAGNLDAYDYYAVPGADNQGSMADFEIRQDDYGPAIFVGTGPDLSGVHTSAGRFVGVPGTGQQLQLAKMRVKLLSFGPNDNTSVVFRDENYANVFSFNAGRDSNVDSLQRPNVSFVDQSGNPGAPIGPGKLDLNVWYQVEVIYEESTGALLCRITHLGTGALFGEASVTVGDLAPIHRLHFENDHSSTKSAGTGLYDDIELIVGVSTGDMNPAHIIRECLTESVWGRGLPESEIGPSYVEAADTLHAEGLGLSLLWTEETPLADFIDEIMRHIDAVRYEDPSTGLQEIKLIRDDYDVATLPVLDPSNSDVTAFDNAAVSELVNQVTITYWNRAADSQAAITVQDTAAITMVGSIVNATYDYPGVTRDDVAMMLAQRDLASTSRPYARGTVVTHRDAADLKPGDVFKLNDPDNGVSGMICRIAKRSDSGALDGQITLEWGEDVFGAGFAIFDAVTESGWSDPVGAPADFAQSTAFEVPYFEIVQAVGDSYINQVPIDACYYGFAGARPATGVHLNYDLYSYPDGTVQPPDQSIATSSDFAPWAAVVGAVSDLTQTVIPVDSIRDSGQISVGDLVLIGDGLDASREIASVDAAVAEGATSVTLKRGVADTIPRAITDGTVLYFIGDPATTETEYLPGETIEGYGVPLTGSGAFEGPYTYNDVTMSQRFYRPYPPANFKVDGFYESGYTVMGDTAVLTWAHRDRVGQSDQTIGWFDAANYGPETGTGYRLEVTSIDGTGVEAATPYFTVSLGAVATYTYDQIANPPPAGTEAVVFRLWTTRDGLDSLQHPSFSAALVTLAAPYNLSVEAVV